MYKHAILYYINVLNKILLCRKVVLYLKDVKNAKFTSTFSKHRIHLVYSRFQYQLSLSSSHSLHSKRSLVLSLSLPLPPSARVMQAPTNS